MKTTLGKSITVFLVTICLYCGCNDNSVDSNDNVSNTNFVAEEPFSFEVNVVNHSKLRLEGISGNVIIAGMSGTNSVMITGERRVGSESSQDAEAHLPELQVTVQDLANEVFVKTTQPQY